MIKSVLKAVFPGVSWQNPVLAPMFRAIDPIDYVVRRRRGLGDLPPYSIRIRSNGIRNQFGGKNFHRFGHRLAEHLKAFASLKSDSKVLEIGCGCGRTAIALTDTLDDGNYVGMDIERISLKFCARNPLLSRKKFRFDLLDIQNDEYNPRGLHRADNYRFPYPADSFDVIFLASVFTHMLSSDVSNYIAEISRMLRPGGSCMLTLFLMDKGRHFDTFSFPHRSDDHYYYNVAMPEVAIGYFSDFYVSRFAAGGMRPSCDILWGSWRNSEQVVSTSGFAQDILFFRKAA